jgi:hypothetical protein
MMTGNAGRAARLMGSMMEGDLRHSGGFLLPAGIPDACPDQNDIGLFPIQSGNIVDLLYFPLRPGIVAAGAFEGSGLLFFSQPLFMASDTG